MRSLLLCVLCAVAAVPVLAQKPIPVILDTDIGDDIDDAYALSLAVQSPELDIRAVVTVLQQGQRRADLAWKILGLFGRTDIPVGVGAQTPLLGTPSDAVVRQTLALRPEDQQPVSQRHNGISLLIDTCLKAPEKVTLLAYGPLTNLALALRAEPRIREHVERIVLMNGIFFKPEIEYNTVRDAEASAIVYASGLPILTVGLDVTRQCRFSADDMGRLSASRYPTAQFLMQITRLWQNNRPEARPTLHDPLAVAVSFRPSFIRTQTGTVEVELKGTPKKTYGMTLFRPDPKGTTQVASEVESRAFLDFLLERVLAPPRGR